MNIRRYFINFVADMVAAAMCLSIFYVFTFKIAVTHVSAEQAAENRQITENIESSMTDQFDSERISDDLGDCIKNYLSADPNASSECIDAYANADSGVYYRVDKVTTVDPDGEPLVFTVADITMKNLSSLHRGFVNDTFDNADTQKPLDMLLSTDGVIGSSGDNYAVSGIGLVVKDGVWYREGSNDVDICALYTDGTMKTFDAGTYSSEELKQEYIWQLWSFGPALMDGNGHALTEFNAGNTDIAEQNETGYLYQKHPRTVLGYVEPGHYLLLVVDGRNEGYSIGVGLEDLALMCEKLGMTTAYNLDGGKTSTLMNRDGLLTTPCGKTTDDGTRIYTDGRPMTDIIYVEP